MNKFYDSSIVTCAMSYNKVTGWAYKYKDGYNASNVLHTGVYLPLDALMDNLVTVDTFSVLADLDGMVAYTVMQSTGGAGWFSRIATVDSDGMLVPSPASFDTFLADTVGTLVFAVQMFSNHSLVFKVGA